MSGELSSAPERIVVPPSRVEGNPLANMLRRDGWEVIEFPLLSAGPSGDTAALERAVREVDRFDWVLFAGRRSAETFLDRFAAADPDAREFPARIATVGGGARAAVRERGFETDYHPPRHTAVDVAAAWPLSGNSRILLVRVEGATSDLPRELAARRARVSTVSGYSMSVSSGSFGQDVLLGVGTVALPNGAAARNLAEGLALVGLDVAGLAGVRVVAVGETTAEEARSLGLPVTEVANGSLAGLLSLLRRGGPAA